MSIVVLIAIRVVIGLLIAAFAGSIWKGERPYGEVVDYIVSIVFTILTGFADWYLAAEWFNFEGALRFAISVLEPPFVALIALWILRVIKSKSASN